MELTKKHSGSQEVYTMNSIEELFDNSNRLIEGIHRYSDRYIGNSLLPFILWLSSNFSAAIPALAGLDKDFRIRYPF